MTARFGLDWRPAEPTEDERWEHRAIWLARLRSEPSRGCLPVKWLGDGWGWSQDGERIPADMIGEFEWAPIGWDYQAVEWPEVA